MNDETSFYSKYTIPFVLTGMIAGVGVFLYNKIVCVEKEVKEVEANLLRKLTAQLANQTSVIREAIISSDEE